MLYERKYIEETKKIYEDKINQVDDKVKAMQKQDTMIFKGELDAEFQEK